MATKTKSTTKTSTKGTLNNIQNFLSQSFLKLVKIINPQSDSDLKKAQQQAVGQAQQITGATADFPEIPLEDQKKLAQELYELQLQKKQFQSKNTLPPEDLQQDIDKLKQEINSHQLHGTWRAELIGEEQTPINVKKPKRTKESQPLPVIGQPQAPPPPTPSIALPRPTARRLSEKIQTQRRAAIDKSAARVQQIANYGPIRGALHKLGAVTGFNAAKHKVGQAINKGKQKVKKGLAKTFAKIGGKKLVKAAGKLAVWGGAALTGIGTVVSAIGLGFQLSKLLWKNKEMALAALSYLQIMIAKVLALLTNALTAALTIAGGVLGFTIGGPIGAVLGASGGFTLSQSILKWFGSKGGVGPGVNELAHGRPAAIADAQGIHAGVTPNFTDTITGGGFSTAAATVPATLITTPLFVTFGTAAFFTFFTLMVIFVAFTVPNPLPTQSPYIIYGSDDQPYTELPNPIPPTSGNLNTDIINTASSFCVPENLVKAIMQTESNAYNWSDSEYQTFSSNGWWENATVTEQTVTENGNNVLSSQTLQVNCYDQHYTSSIRETEPDVFKRYVNSACQQGYCYDTCTETGICGGRYGDNCANDIGEVCESYASSTRNDQICPVQNQRQCTTYDVYGATQFLRTTFYGGNCAYRDGVGPPGSCTINEGLNRCNAADIVTATANKLFTDSGLSCPLDEGDWTVEKVCQVAKSYCGSCGEVEGAAYSNPDDYRDKPEFPCYSVYSQPGDAGYNSGACGGITDGYCDKVAKLYFGNTQ